MFEINEFFPVQHHNGKDGSQLDHHFVHIGEGGGTDTNQRIGELHVRRAGNRQKFSKPFHNGYDNGLENIHVVDQEFFGRRKMATISITNPARMMMGAMVILLTPYTSSGLKTLGSLLRPPAMSRKPTAITASPISIH